MPRAAALALGICAVCCYASPAPEDPWLRIRSTNFELFTTAGERSGRDLIRHFERVRAFFVQAFGFGTANSRPARIIAFRSEKEYAPYRPSEAAAAFFHPGSDRDVIVMQTASGEHYPVAVHEYTHLLIHQTGLKAPLWLNEGMAELYSNLQPKGSQIVVGGPIEGRAYSLRLEKWLDLPTLLAVDHDSALYNDKNKAGIFYAESWLLVHMLNLSPAYKSNLNALITNLQQQSGVAAFQKVYGMPIAKVQEDLRAYATSNSISAAVFNIQLPKTVDAPEVETGAALPARLALAELLATSGGRAKQAKAALEQLARDYPNSWQVESAWAQFCNRQCEDGEAERHYARAIERGSNDARMFLEYSNLLAYAKKPDDAIATLRRAAKMEPPLDEVHDQLGMLLFHKGEYQDALAEFRLVKKVKPEEAPRYFYAMAYASYRVGERAAGLALLEKGRPFAKSPDQIAMYAGLTEALNQKNEPAARAPQKLSEERPMMTRAAPPDAPEPGQKQTPDELPVMDGLLENVECIGKIANLHVRVEGIERKLVIPDPEHVIIRSGTGEAVEFSCGAQKARRIRIEYQPIPGRTDVTGAVRTLEFL